MTPRLASVIRLLAGLTLAATACARQPAPILDRQAVLERHDWWDNRDWDWYAEQIPFFESPDPLLDATYYYRWEVLTKHLTYGSPETGYTFTEFTDRPFWSGAYGAISCPLGHQHYELRWLKDRRIIDARCGRHGLSSSMRSASLRGVVHIAGRGGRTRTCRMFPKERESVNPRRGI